MRKVDFFQNSCLRKICNRPNKISNVELHKKADSMNMSLEMKTRRLRWIGHVLRIPEDKIPKAGMRWTPSRRRKRGRPKTTWWRTVMKEQEEMGLTWGEAVLRSFVGALCPRRDEEDESGPGYMVSGTRDNPPPEASLSSVYIWKTWFL